MRETIKQKDFARVTTSAKEVVNQRARESVRHRALSAVLAPFDNIDNRVGRIRTFLVSSFIFDLTGARLCQSISLLFS